MEENSVLSQCSASSQRHLKFLENMLFEKKKKENMLFDKDCSNLIKVWKQCISASLENSVNFFVVETFHLNHAVCLLQSARCSLLAAVCSLQSVTLAASLHDPWSPVLFGQAVPHKPSSRIRESHGRVTRPLCLLSVYHVPASVLSAVRELSHFSFQRSFEQGGSVSSSRWGN